jgi:acyl carrier protein
MFYAGMGMWFRVGYPEMGRAVELDDQVKQVISKSLKIPIEQLTDSSTLEDFGAESIDIIELVFELEEKFDIEISVKPSKDALVLNTGTNTPGLSEIGFMTIGDIAAAVKRLVDAKAA